MRTYTRTISNLAIFVLLLTGALATAQSGNAANRKAGDPPAPSNEKKTKTTGNMQSAQSNPVFQENQNQGDMPTHGRRNSVVNQDESNSKGGLHNAQSNPLYEKKMEGTNPLYEGRNVDDNDPSRHHPSQSKATNVQPSANDARHDTVEYKDTEDMHTRYRAGNNKTTRLQLEGNKREPAAAPYKDPEDMTTRSKAPDNKTSKPH